MSYQVASHYNYRIHTIKYTEIKLDIRNGFNNVGCLFYLFPEMILLVYVCWCFVFINFTHIAVQCPPLN